MAGSGSSWQTYSIGSGSKQHMQSLTARPELSLHVLLILTIASTCKCSWMEVTTAVIKHYEKWCLLGVMSATTAAACVCAHTHLLACLAAMHCCSRAGAHQNARQVNFLKSAASSSDAQSRHVKLPLAWRPQHRLDLQHCLWHKLQN